MKRASNLGREALQGLTSSADDALQEGVETAAKSTQKKVAQPVKKVASSTDERTWWEFVTGRTPERLKATSEAIDTLKKSPGAVGQVIYTHGRAATGIGLAGTGTLVGGGALLVGADELNDAIMGEDGRSAVPDTASELASKAYQTAKEGAGYLAEKYLPQPEKPPELSGKGALLFGGLGAAIALTAAWVGGAGVGTMALIAGVTAAVTAFGGSLWGGEIAERAIASASAATKPTADSPAEKKEQTTEQTAERGTPPAPQNPAPVPPAPAAATPPVPADAAPKTKISGGDDVKTQGAPATTPPQPKAPGPAPTLSAG
ncbi:MAG: hypothetical protein SFX19_02545 [Alphaproteobacteria bacterium]|nr:hypothetical protein [Alphaproteobacteria bacterium]